MADVLSTERKSLWAFSFQREEMTEFEIGKNKVMDDLRSTRPPLKAHRPDWRGKLRNNCLERVRANRAHLLWKMRTNRSTAEDQKEIMESEFRNIVSGEMKMIQQSSSNDSLAFSINSVNDSLWEYDGPNTTHEFTESEFGIVNEELLIEMDKVFHEELKAEAVQRELEVLETVYEEEDTYLAQAVYEQMRLNDEKAEGKDTFWCPICKRGELQQNNLFISCSCCKLQLDIQSDKVNLDFLRIRLAEAHVEHLDRGCHATPKFSLEAKFNITALYVYCRACDTFEIVL
ncbi:uncharacterized protein [Aristolochia californica]|uniref:uncharacterized protein isoform X2 n=1 Tax=Aristolochia californica TaxID=171875 RepID=UPI0035E26F14